MHQFKQLHVWQESLALAKKVYVTTASFPSDEKYGLTSQIRRSAASIPSNIPEGAGRTTNRDFVRFLSIALGSAFELETHLLLSKELNLIDKDDLGQLEVHLRKTQKMLYTLMQKYKEQ